MELAAGGCTPPDCLWDGERAETLGSDGVRVFCAAPIQVPPGHVDFTVFNWPALLKRLKQMQMTGAQPTLHGRASGWDDSSHRRVFVVQGIKPGCPCILTPAAALQPRMCTLDRGEC